MPRKRFLGDEAAVVGPHSFTTSAGIDPTPTPTAASTPGAFTEITPHAPAVTASTNDGNLPGNIGDGSLDTRWSASGDGQLLFQRQLTPGPFRHPGGHDQAAHGRQSSPAR